MDGLPYSTDLRFGVPPAPLAGTTRLSCVTPLDRASRAPAARVACASLGLLVLMTSGCLITDPPQFKPPEHTKPWLDPITADPDPQKVVVIDGEVGVSVSAPATMKFSAEVMSQDDTGDGKFKQVETWLYIDLGYSGVDPFTPYAQAIRGTTLPSGSIEQKGRRVSASWHLQTQDVPPGCHRATLMVSHIFDEIPCPVCNDDYTAITWKILRCDTSNGDCGALPVTGANSCEGLSNSCSTVRAKLLAADAGVPECPSGTADGGSP